MNEQMISQICLEIFSEFPSAMERCTVGQGNYVYIVECSGNKYVIRCSEERNAYENTIYWLQKLEAIDIPVPKVIGSGVLKEYEYLVLSYFDGIDIGLVYSQLTEDDKKTIAKEIVKIQNKVAALKLENTSSDWTWQTFVNDMLERAEKRIA